MPGMEPGVMEHWAVMEVPVDLSSGFYGLLWSEGESGSVMEKLFYYASFTALGISNVIHPKPDT